MGDVGEQPDAAGLVFYLAATVDLDECATGASRRVTAGVVRDSQERLGGVLGAVVQLGREVRARDLQRHDHLHRHELRERGPERLDLDVDIAAANRSACSPGALRSNRIGSERSATVSGSFPIPAMAFAQ